MREVRAHLPRPWRLQHREAAELLAKKTGVKICFSGHWGSGLGQLRGCDFAFGVRSKKATAKGGQKGCCYCEAATRLYRGRTPVLWHMRAPKRFQDLRQTLHLLFYTQANLAPRPCLLNHQTYDEGFRRKHVSFFKLNYANCFSELFNKFAIFCWRKWLYRNI